MIKALILLSLFTITSTAYADTAKRDAVLAGDKKFDLALPFEDFTPRGATGEAQPLEGQLRLDMAALSGGFQLILDSYGAAQNPQAQVRVMPQVDISLIQDGDYIIPIYQGITETKHPYFDIIYTPGRTWAEPDGRRFISLPFALMEKNANCIHNGALLVAISPDGQASHALMQVGSETCAYFQFNFWAVFDAEWQARNIAGAADARASYRGNKAARLPIRTMADLPEGLDAKEFSQDVEIAPAFMSTYGLVLDGVHYHSGCGTRLGPYPHCETMVLPSYSLAKSLAGGLGLMRLDALYGDTSSQTVASLIPDCADWGNVTLSHLLNMTTGRYASRTPHADEASAGYLPFFTLTNDTEKTAFACNYFDSETDEGKQWVYHTSDTYLLGVAMNSFLKAHGDGDFYRDHLVPIWEALDLSPLMADIRRTRGAGAVPFTGYGMIFTADDIARVASALASSDTRLTGQLAQASFEAAMQRTPSDRGMRAGSDNLKYKNGFWAWNARESLGCEADTWLPFFSGFGGITVVLLPGGNVYYYFSDSGVHVFAEPIKALSAVTPICGVSS
ncbi:hypothetical protein [Kordiimonas sp.]|uniref:hypothetical protein n=1 Tax=Kordiimonas sp. TaxID=1970157 RepID=UPI003A8FE473